jgi:hypothetical protein
MAGILEGYLRGVEGAKQIANMKKQNELFGLRNLLAGQVAEGGFNPSESLDFQQYSVLDPQGAAATLANYEALDDSRKRAMFQDAQEGLRLLESERDQDFLDLAVNRNELIKKFKGDSSDTESVINSFLSGDRQGVIQQLKLMTQAGIERGYLADPNKTKKEGLASARSQIFDNGTTVALLPDGSTQVTNPAGEVVTGDERRQVLKQARQEQIGFAASKAAATESGKAKAQAKASDIIADTKAKIASAQELAKVDAKSRGKSLSALGVARAGLPGLQDVVLQLKELAPLATNTFAGRAFNEISKQLGFGSTKGSTARAQFTSIVDNQVLPLLKQTFGAAFTNDERLSLAATLGDVDAGAEEKMAQLDAFINGKIREIQTIERELGKEVTPTAVLKEQPATQQAPVNPAYRVTDPRGEIMTDAQGNRARVFPDGRIEEL